MSVPNLLKVKQFSGKHEAFPEGGLRHQIFHADSNGLTESGALIRNGRNVLIDEEKYFAWLLKRSQEMERSVG